MTDTKKRPAKKSATAEEPAQNEGTADSGYRVLARKYRPQTFNELVGQDALVRTLTNAINTGRVAHGFMLTGVRGIGKTTTARIIAKALNCIGPDGTGGPTIDPCGVCEHCVAITEDRHIDVMEVDAASHTGVANVRENIIDGVQYRPAAARYKVYIIDEVHMLSTPAFNALLKTLEEPPEHVKFVFATTEIGKVPVTVLSRCQRFDLRRLDSEMLAGHLADVAEKEGARLDEGAIGLLARAADGSVRDGLSLLDQVIAQSGSDGPVTAETVRTMLGLADRAQVLDLFDLVMKGDAGAAITLADELYRAGADPVALVQDLLEVTHWLTRLKVTPDTAIATGYSNTEKDRAAGMAAALAMPILGRAWQMLLKGQEEVRGALRAITALEMLLIRLCYVAELPTPGDIVKELDQSDSPTANGAGAAASPTTPGDGTAAVRAAGIGGAVAATPAAELAPEEPAPRSTTSSAGAGNAQPRSFEAAVDLFADNREALLHAHLRNDVRLVAFEPGRIEINPTAAAPPNLANRVGALLTEWTGTRWVVSVSAAEGAPTLKQTADEHAAATFAEAADNPVVRAVLDTFPGAKITEVRDIGTADSPPEETDT